MSGMYKRISHTCTQCKFDVGNVTRFNFDLVYLKRDTPASSKMNFSMIFVGGESNYLPDRSNFCDLLVFIIHFPPGGLRSEGPRDQAKLLFS